MVVDLEPRDTKPTSLTDFSKIIFTTENGGLGMATELQRSGAETAGTVDFEKFGFSFRFLDCHIKGMVRSEAASTQEREFFFRSSNFLISVQILEIGFGDAAETFLEPAATALTNLQFVTGLQLGIQNFVSSIHFLTHDAEDGECCSLIALES